MKIAVPTNNPGGLDAERSDHFGHCDLFTVISLEPGSTVAEVATIENGGHEAGGCMTPVKLLSDAGVQAIVVGGMGARPMQGFSQAGIDVYFADRTVAVTVKSVVELFVEDKLPKMHATQVCKGSGNCQH
ncbi:NifB/NifX family molybdenum-iron cluster-binding protein [Desulfosediminicola ganghwensis]|uniref:NifB/NifX family molybdenum-iron cluster-binding protein n=1 Tax=Desulfosediminicola ganghwensis TaxID=2569540 RepID=UPI0010ADA53B|nr:NifB/NifX family molybdenum-iron cluster-binding protein [Desulfosediminicola ganghwensis]